MHNSGIWINYDTLLVSYQNHGTFPLSTSTITTAPVAKSNTPLKSMHWGLIRIRRFSRFLGFFVLQFVCCHCFLLFLFPLFPASRFWRHPISWIFKLYGWRAEDMLITVKFGISFWIYRFKPVLIIRIVLCEIFWSCTFYWMFKDAVTKNSFVLARVFV